MSNWEFHHEAMATDFALLVAHPREDYARQAAASAWRELDRLEGELSRYVEGSDIARANRLAEGESTIIGHDAFECLWQAASVVVATRGAFDPAYASTRCEDCSTQPLPFALDPATHALTSRAERLQLDLGAIGKGYALDRLAEHLAEWEITTACLQSGGSTVLALDAPDGSAGWPVGVDRVTTTLARRALSASGLAVKGSHLIDPRTGVPARRVTRTWAWAPSAALSDALSTAFFVMSDEEIAAFCTAHPEIGAAFLAAEGTLVTWSEGRAERVERR